MSRNLDWREFIDEEGSFELAEYLYSINVDLMKNALDMGTLLSTDKVRLRAYKEQIKAYFKNRWMETAEALEHFDLIVPCGCSNEYCTVCGGARYRFNSALSPDELRDISVVVSDSSNDEVEQKLRRGLAQALSQIEEYIGKKETHT